MSNKVKRKNQPEETKEQEQERETQTKPSKPGKNNDSFTHKQTPSLKDGQLNQSLISFSAIDEKKITQHTELKKYYSLYFESITCDPPRIPNFSKPNQEMKIEKVNSKLISVVKSKHQEELKESNENMYELSIIPLHFPFNYLKITNPPFFQEYLDLFTGFLASPDSEFLFTALHFKRIENEIINYLDNTQEIDPNSNLGSEEKEKEKEKGKGSEEKRNEKNIKTRGEIKKENDTSSESQKSEKVKEKKKEEKKPTDTNVIIKENIFIKTLKAFQKKKIKVLRKLINKSQKTNISSEIISLYEEVSLSVLKKENYDLEVNFLIKQFQIRIIKKSKQQLLIWVTDLIQICNDLKENFGITEKTNLQIFQKLGRLVQLEPNLKYLRLEKMKLQNNKHYLYNKENLNSVIYKNWKKNQLQQIDSINQVIIEFQENRLSKKERKNKLSKKIKILKKKNKNNKSDDDGDDNSIDDERENSNDQDSKKKKNNKKENKKKNKKKNKKNKKKKEKTKNKKNKEIVGKVQIKIFSGKGLLAKRKNQICNPTVQLIKGRFQGRTSTVISTTDPVWNPPEIFEFDIHDPEKETVQLNVLDLKNPEHKKQLPKKKSLLNKSAIKFLGRLNFQISDYAGKEKNDTKRDWMALEKRSKKSNIAGHLEVQIKYINEQGLKNEQETDDGDDQNDDDKEKIDEGSNSSKGKENEKEDEKEDDDCSDNESKDEEKKGKGNSLSSNDENNDNNPRELSKDHNYHQILNFLMKKLIPSNISLALTQSNETHENNERKKQNTENNNDYSIHKIIPRHLRFFFIEFCTRYFIPQYYYDLQLLYILLTNFRSNSSFYSSIYEIISDFYQNKVWLNFTTIETQLFEDCLRMLDKLVEYCIKNIQSVFPTCDRNHCILNLINTFQIVVKIKNNTKMNLSDQQQDNTINDSKFKMQGEIKNSTIQKEMHRYFAPGIEKIYNQVKKKIKSQYPLIKKELPSKKYFSIFFNNEDKNNTNLKNGGNNSNNDGNNDNKIKSESGSEIKSESGMESKSKCEKDQENEKKKEQMWVKDQNKTKIIFNFNNGYQFSIYLSHLLNEIEILIEDYLSKQIFIESFELEKFIFEKINSLINNDLKTFLSKIENPGIDFFHLYSQIRKFNISLIQILGRNFTSDNNDNKLIDNKYFLNGIQIWLNNNKETMTNLIDTIFQNEEFVINDENILNSSTIIDLYHFVNENLKFLTMLDFIDLKFINIMEQFLTIVCNLNNKYLVDIGEKVNFEKQLKKFLSFKTVMNKRSEKKHSNINNNTNQLTNDIDNNNKDNSNVLKKYCVLMNNIYNIKIFFNDLVGQISDFCLGIKKFSNKKNDKDNNISDSSNVDESEDDDSEDDESEKDESEDDESEDEESGKGSGEGKSGEEDGSIEKKSKKKRKKQKKKPKKKQEKIIFQYSKNIKTSINELLNNQSKVFNSTCLLLENNIKNEIADSLLTIVELNSKDLNNSKKGKSLWGIQNMKLKFSRKKNNNNDKNLVKDEIEFEKILNFDKSYVTKLMGPLLTYFRIHLKILNENLYEPVFKRLFKTIYKTIIQMIIKCLIPYNCVAKELPENQFSKNLIENNNLQLFVKIIEILEEFFTSELNIKIQKKIFKNYNQKFTKVIKLFQTPTKRLIDTFNEYYNWDFERREDETDLLEAEMIIRILRVRKTKDKAAKNFLLKYKL
ncbi:transcription initiation factor tfiid subunit [Anaeramoeba flamelloides]|uniref:Transcription initiation factor tfiid subunit n=1 Tax=Anaeramoeba flamelloides TaxID=1746091 RepID=A0AAV8AGX0_9EUKA|nr:transcription initiation factor tfiid subunit [Anaeramoeba flamelloides]